MGKGLDNVFRWYAVIAIVVLNTLLLALAIEYGLGLARDFRQSAGSGELKLVDKDIYKQAYGKYPLTDDLLREISSAESRPDWARFEPYCHWLSKPLAGTYINVDEKGRRKTTGPTAPNARVVLLFGGSTAFCAQSPDDLTIASLLQSKLGPAYRVINMGQGGFVSTQEVNLLLKVLAEGDRPYAVIFYDGVNDTFSGAYSPAIPRDPHGVREEAQAQRAMAQRQELSSPIFSRFVALYRGSNVERFFQWLRFERDQKGRSFIQGEGIEKWDRGIEASIAKNAEATVKYYMANVDAVWALSKHYNFHPFFFWQPNLLTLKRPLTPQEEKMLESVRPSYQRCQRTVDSLARDAFSGKSELRVFDITDTFDASSDAIYVDFCHVGPTGNALVAERIYAHLAASNIFNVK